MAENTTNPLPSISEPVVDRYRRWNPLWYKFLKPLLETVRASNVRIDAMEDSYTISVNQNGRVTGSVKLDGTPALSSFAVLADKFIIVHPSVNATEVQAFVVGLVNGVPTVGINGNLVVDNTILARHIDVSSLSAITADIGTVTAGLIRDPSDQYRMDIVNGRHYTTDGTMEIDFQSKRFRMGTV